MAYEYQNGYQRELGSIVYNFFDKKARDTDTSATCTANTSTHAATASGSAVTLAAEFREQRADN